MKREGARAGKSLQENDKEKFIPILWTNFGRVFKEGLGEDFANKERILKDSPRCLHAQRQTTSRTCRWPSTWPARTHGLAEECRYYVTADSFAAAKKSSPHLEVRSARKGIEVILLSRPSADEWWLGQRGRVRGVSRSSRRLAEGRLLDLGRVCRWGRSRHIGKTAEELKAVDQDASRPRAGRQSEGRASPAACGMDRRA